MALQKPDSDLRRSPQLMSAWVQNVRPSYPQTRSTRTVQKNDIISIAAWGNGNPSASLAGDSRFDSGHRNESNGVSFRFDQKLIEIAEFDSRRIRMKIFPLWATKVRQVKESSDLEQPGDMCIRPLKSYNSTSVRMAVIMKCPYCGMDMASTGIHKIKYSRVRRLLSTFGLPFGPSVYPKLACPQYPAQHIFSITNGRITPATN